MSTTQTPPDTPDLPWWGDDDDLDADVEATLSNIPRDEPWWGADDDIITEMVRDPASPQRLLYHVRKHPCGATFLEVRPS